MNIENIVILFLIIFTFWRYIKNSSFKKFLDDLFKSLFQGISYILPKLFKLLEKLLVFLWKFIKWLLYFVIEALRLLFTSLREVFFER